MIDLISRQAAIDAIDEMDIEYYVSPHLKDERTEEQKRKDWFDMCNVLIQQKIKGLPSVQPQRWIPVSEKLPNESDGKVLITVSGKVETGKYSEYSTTWFVGTMAGVGGDEPIAWMPLPEAYKGGQDD